MKKYTYQIGEQEYNCYDETVNGLADLCNGILSKDQITYAIQQLQKQITENTYIHSIDIFGLILHYCEKQNAEYAEVIEKIE
jgi:hypothetical protein